MCELLGISCNRPTDISFSFSVLQENSEIHDDGWGVAFYRNHPDTHQPFATAVKEPLPAHRTIFADFLKNHITSNLFIAHIRRVSVGSVTGLNTHPFELMLDPRPGADTEKSWVFAHNGTVAQIKQNEAFKLEGVTTHGNTDSEHAFCWIIKQLRDRYRQNSYSLSIEEKRSILEDCANKIKPHGTFNFLVSDGDILFAYHSGNTLYYLIRDGKKYQEYKDESDGLALCFPKPTDECAAIVATAKLSNENWQEMPTGRVLMFKDGTLLLHGDEQSERST